MGPMEERVQRLLEPTVSALGYELLGVEYLSQGKHSRVRLYIDQPGGISLEDCESVSRQVSAVLDVEDPINNQYSLEVSSPGLDRPLFKPEHFERFAGHKVKLKLKLPHQGRRKFEGEIQKVDQKQIYIGIENGEQLVLVSDDIERANLKPEI